MRNRVTVLFAFVAFAAAGICAFAQAAGSGGTAIPRQGFSVPGLISELSLFLPAEATRGMYGGLGGRGGGQGGGGQQVGGPPGSAGQQSQTGQAAPSGQQRPDFQFTRDPKLFLTHDQTAKLLPILSALRDAPMPTPSTARKVQADVDAILTAAQKAEYEQFRKAIENLRQGFSRSGTQAQGGATQGGPAQNGTAQNGTAKKGGAPLSTLERRQRQLDAFIKIMQARL